MDPPPNGGRPGSRTLGTVPAVLLVALAYWIVANAGRVLANYGVVTAVWPPTGLALALLTIGGLRLWPGVFLGVVLAVGVETPPAPLPITLPPLAVLTMAAGNTAEAMLGAIMLRSLAGFTGCVDTVRKALALLFVPLVASVVSATVGNVTLLAVGGTTLETLPNTWWTWWVGNALGIVCVAPFVFAVMSPWTCPQQRRWRLEAAALVGFSGATAAYAMFGAFPSAPRATRETWLLYPYLVWAAIRFGPQAAATGVFVVGALALVSTAWRLGSYADATMADAVLRVQVFVGVVAASIVLLAAFVAERWRAYAALSVLNDGLEGKVAARTAELQRINELLTSRNAELAAANEELDGFSSKVSHDLRAPVRAVSGFTEVLRAQYGGALGAEGTALLDRIARAGVRMASLIDGLLEMSRVGRRALDVVEVDPNPLVAAIVEDLVPTGDVEVRVGALPRCRADAVMLDTVFTNLLQNAVKYGRGAERPLVEVGGERGPGVVTYWVRDNGVGFDMKDVGKLFRAFSRLHGAPFEGSGVGLATVRRIVELHGGRVWAQGAVGEGATFSFQLPDGPEPPDERQK